MNAQINKIGALHPSIWGPNYPGFTSYVDEAGHAKDPQRTFLCLAGLIARNDAWEKFDGEWRTVCAEEGIQLPFHMKDFAAFRGQFTDWTEGRRIRSLGKLVETIRRAKAIPTGSVVSVKDFDSLPPRVKAAMRDPYFVAFQPLTYHIAVAASMEEPVGGPVTMMYAHHPEHSDGLGSAGELWQRLRETNRLVSLFMESYVCGEQVDHTPLQAADLWAYELGHHFEVIRPASKKPRWAFQQFVAMGLKYSFTHDFITLWDAMGVCGVGSMSRVQQWREISLSSPGFAGCGQVALIRWLRQLAAARAQAMACEDFGRAQ